MRLQEGSRSQREDISSIRCMTALPAFGLAAFYETQAHDLSAPQIGFQKRESKFT
jgi:hypothetical protein